MSGIITSSSPGWVGKILGGYSTKAIERALDAMNYGPEVRGNMLHRTYLNALPGSITQGRRDAEALREAVKPTMTDLGADHLIRGLRTRQDALGETLVTLPVAASLLLLAGPQVALVGAGMCLMNLVFVAKDVVLNGLPANLSLSK